MSAAMAVPPPTAAKAARVVSAIRRIIRLHPDLGELSAHAAVDGSVVALVARVVEALLERLLDGLGGREVDRQHLVDDLQAALEPGDGLLGQRLLLLALVDLEGAL